MNGCEKNGCRPQEPLCRPTEVTAYPSLSMVYPPRQCWRELYNADIGLSRGTIFRELDKPWQPCRGGKGCGV